MSDWSADVCSADLELHIDDIAIKADTEAILRLRSLIGERYVELTDVWTGEGDQLKSDDVIPLDRTVVPAEITDVLDEAARVSKELDGETLGRVLDELALVVGDDGVAVEALLDELAQAGTTVAGHADAPDELTGAPDTAGATLAEQDPNGVAGHPNGPT